MQKFWKKFRLSEPARTARSEPVERLEIEIMSADGAGVSTALIRPGIHAGYIKVQAPIGFPHTVQAELGSDHAFLIRGAVDSAVGHGRKASSATRFRITVPTAILPFIGWFPDSE